MNSTSIHFIINPAAGNDEPILSYINTAFQNSNVTWDVSVTKEEGEAGKIAKALIGKVDIVAVYGGDGSVAEVARSLIGSGVPFAIIPGGTANILSRELGWPQDTEQALAVLAKGEFNTREIDAASANGDPFFIRVNVGIMADMVLQASRDLKDKLGQLAYGISAVKTIINSDLVRYSLELDGLHVDREGVALTITNCGSTGIGDYSFLPEIHVDDGLLDVILMHKADLFSVLRIAGSTLIQSGSEVLDHWKCKDVIIRFEQEQTYILDDCERKASCIEIKTMHKALTVIVPANDNAR